MTYTCRYALYDVLNLEDGRSFIISALGIGYERPSWCPISNIRIQIKTKWDKDACHSMIVYCSINNLDDNGGYNMCVLVLF